MDVAVPVPNRIVCFEAEAHQETKYSMSLLHMREWQTRKENLKEE